MNVYGVEEAADILGVDPDVLGARLRLPRFGRKRRPSITPGSRQAPYRQPPLVPGQQQPSSELRSYVGMGIAVWTAADGADKPLTIEPQESFRGERLIIDFAAVGGTSAGIVVVRSINVGTLPQSPSIEQPGPAAMFRADATYSALDLQVAHRGMKLNVTMGITAVPGAGVTVTAVVGFYGQWLR